MVRVTKHDVSALEAIAAHIESLAVANQIVFVYDGDVVAGKGESLMVDPAAEVPISVGKDNIVRVRVVLAEQ